MPSTKYPSSLTPDERRAEIATILARAFSRLRTDDAEQRALAGPNSCPQSQNHLDLPAETRHMVTTVRAVNAFGDTEPQAVAGKDLP